jgi:hypothetical protein
VTASGSGSVAATVVQVDGASGVVPVVAEEVDYFPGGVANNGVKTKCFTVTTTGATPGTCSFAIPSGTAGAVTVLVSANNGTDAGAQSWSGKVMNVGGTVTVNKAFAAVDSWDASSGATTWSFSAAMSGANLVGTCTASSGAGSTTWTVAYQYVTAT